MWFGLLILVYLHGVFDYCLYARVSNYCFEKKQWFADANVKWVSPVYPTAPFAFSVAPSASASDKGPPVGCHC